MDTAVEGLWLGTAERLAMSLGGTSLSRALAPFYMEQCALYGLRADIVWAQMALETNDLKFGGQVTWRQNNWGGLKNKDASAFASFAIPAWGVAAHVQHVAWYVKRACLVPCGSYDPRHLGPHGSNGWVVKVADFAGKWCPSPDYAVNIVARANAIGLGVV